jgi:protein-tyrosine phosphatase
MNLMNDLSMPVKRDANTYQLALGDVVSAQGLKIIPSLSADRLEGGYPAYTAESGEVEITVVDTPKRHFFHLFSASGESQVIAERWLAFDGTPNFRDYGGYLNQSGKRVRWGHFFRSGQLSSLTQQDITYFESLNIDTVFDFRREEEAQKDVSLFPETRPTILGLAIDPGSILSFFSNQEEGGVSAKDMEGFMCDINSEFAIDHAPVYKKMFEKLLSGDSQGSLIHCSAGKDRTGFAAAVILSALGVSRDVVMHDYLLTAQYFDADREIARISKKYNWSGASEVIRPMLAVKESYLSAAFDAIDNNFTAMNVYLEEMLGLGEEEREFLQNHYLV